MTAPDEITSAEGLCNVEFPLVGGDGCEEEGKPTCRDEFPPLPLAVSDAVAEPELVEEYAYETLIGTYGGHSSTGAIV